MKKFLSILLMAILSIQISAQDIWFIHPSNGETINNNFSENQVAVNISYNKELSMSYYYIKLLTHDSTYSSRTTGIPQWRYLAAGTYTWKLELWEGQELAQEYKTAEETITFHVKFNISVKNSFGGGTIKIDNSTLSSGSSKLKFVGDNLSVEAIDQSFLSYNYTWNTSGTNNSIWQRKEKNDFNYHNILGATSRTHDYTIQSSDNYTTIQAAMRKKCNITFSNQLNGTTYGGQIKVATGAWESAPTDPDQVIEQNQITATAKSSYDISGIRYSFQKWSNNSTNIQTNFTPTAHTNYTAIYEGIPLFDEVTANGSLRNLSIGATAQGYVKLTWSEHPNTNVTKYYVYRHYKLGSYQSTPQLIATRNRGTLQYTDLNYELDVDGDYQLMYDVKAYFSLDGTKSSPSPVTVIGNATNIATKIGSGEEAITYYDISNYPNPYNPQTTIRFQLPKEGFVTIKVYNSIGEEIKTLLNEQMGYGKYELKFDGGDLPSGMYIYTINVNDYYASKKMLLVK